MLEMEVEYKGVKEKLENLILAMPDRQSLRDFMDYLKEEYGLRFDKLIDYHALWDHYMDNDVDKANAFNGEPLKYQLRIPTYRVKVGRNSFIDYDRNYQDRFELIVRKIIDMINQHLGMDEATAAKYWKINWRAIRQYANTIDWDKRGDLEGSENQARLDDFN